MLLKPPVLFFALASSSLLSSTTSISIPLIVGDSPSSLSVPVRFERPQSFWLSFFRSWFQQSGREYFTVIHRIFLQSASSSSSESFRSFQVHPRSSEYLDVEFSLRTANNTWIMPESRLHRLSVEPECTTQSYLGIGPQSSLVEEYGSTALIRLTHNGGVNLSLGSTVNEFVTSCIPDSVIHIPLHLGAFRVGVGFGTRDVSTVAMGNIVRGGDGPLMRLPSYMFSHLVLSLAPETSLSVAMHRILIENCSVTRGQFPDISIGFFDADIHPFNVPFGHITLYADDYIRQPVSDEDVCELLINISDDRRIEIDYLLIPDINIRFTATDVSICDSLDA